MADTGSTEETDSEELLLDRLHETDRSTGLLTQRQREYILNPGKFNGQQERSLRYRIRDRLHHGLLDLVLLNRFMPPPGEWNSILNGNEDLPPGELIYTLVQLSYYFAHYASEQDYREEHTASPIEFFEKHVESAVSVAEAGFAGEEPSVQRINVKVDVVDNEFNEDEIFREIKFGEATVDEFWAYLSHGDQDRLLNFLKQGEQELAIRDPSDNVDKVVTAEDEAIRINFVETDDSDRS